MFRTNILRQAVRAAARPVAVTPRLALRAAAPRVAAAPVFRAVSVRMYGASAGLKKEEVEGRIMSLLQGFDKVRFPALATQVFFLCR